MVSVLGLAAGVAACEPAPAVEAAPRNGGPLSAADFIVLPAVMNPSSCRAPGPMPTSVAQARAERPCRAMKAVQSHLGQMSDFRLHFVDFSDAEPDPICLDGGLTDQEKRVCELFGTTYHPGAVESDHTKRPSPSGRQVFPRLGALLIASTCPIDRHDADDGGQVFDLFGSDLCGGGGQTVQVTADNWWWELPPYYRDIKDIHQRAAEMRADALFWLQNARVRVTSTPGSGGSFDLDAIATLHFLYLLRDHPELLPDTDLLADLLRHGMHLQDYAALDLKMYGNSPLHGDDPWELTSTFQSGRLFSASMDEEVHVGADYIYPETENHILVRATYQYLINQWLTRDYHQNLEGGAHDPYLSDTFLGDKQNDPLFDRWYDNYDVLGQPSELVQRLLAALHRVNHNGFLETNATPDYQAITLRPLLMLATWAEDEDVRVAAENALHVLSAQFAFQSLHGRRLTPARRSCDYAWSNSLYNGMTLAMGAISGAYRWNDSPYGYRSVVEAVAGDPDVADTALACNLPANASECHYRSYTWKRPRVDLALGPYTDATPYNENGNLPGVPSAGNGQVEDLADMVMEARGGMLEALSGYEIPEAIHHFMLTKQDGYFARMMARFDEQHHPAQVLAVGDLEEKKKWPEYFNADLTRWDGGQRDERAPELYFAGKDYLQVAGGVMNALWYGPEAQSWDYPSEADQLLSGGYTCSGETPWLHYLLHYGREDDFTVVAAPPVEVGGTTLPPLNIGLEEYDLYSRPTTLLLGVPEAADPVTGADIYKPFGLRAFPFEEMTRFMPTLPGNRGREWRSVNNGVWKGFGYGYDTSSGKSWAHTTPWEDDPAVPVHPVVFHGLDPEDSNGPGLEFKIYDVRKKLEDVGLEGLWLIVARVWKRELGLPYTTVSRGFWEVVPGDAFGDVEKLESEIEMLNQPADFPATGDDEYQYTSVWTGEKHVLKPEFGYLHAGLLDSSNDIQEVAQGIEQVQSLGGATYSASDYYLALWSDAVMEALPLIDVKAVDSTYQFAWKNTAKTDPTYYACARDGWMCVNAVDPANPTTTTAYLWVDARRCDDRPGLTCGTPAHWEPYWEAGTYDATLESWPCSCGTGGGGWVPGPPETGTADGGGGTPPAPGGGDDDGCVPPACGSCESSLTDCVSDDDCSDGNVCQWHYDPALPRPTLKCGCRDDPSLCDPDANCVPGTTCPSPHHTSCSAGLCVCEGT